VLAATARADVVMVLDCGRTHRAAAIKAKEQFLQVGGSIKGVVVNRVNPDDEGYGYGYYYYYQPTTNAPSKNGRSGLRKILGRSRS
jgi:Mrp family chromosome partitioning ATPase